MLGFLNPSGTQASIGNVTGKLPTPALTMDKRDLGNLNVNNTFNKVYRNVNPYPHNDDNVQTPEAAAASRTSNFVFDNSISGPAQTDADNNKERNWDLDDAATWASWASWMVSIPAAVLAAQQIEKQKKQ